MWLCNLCLPHLRFFWSTPQSKRNLQVEAVKVDASTLLQLAGKKQLYKARIIIVTPSSSDNKLPTPGTRDWPVVVQADATPADAPAPEPQPQKQPQLPHLACLHLDCGVADIKPWLTHAPNLVVLRATEVSDSSL